eukprot:SAG22_NODE_903_length_6590_cov_2.976121_2_plen_88_part_00
MSSVTVAIAMATVDIKNVGLPGAGSIGTLPGVENEAGTPAPEALVPGPVRRPGKELHREGPTEAADHDSGVTSAAISTHAGQEMASH